MSELSDTNSTLQSIPMTPPIATPSVCVFGCGGAGINMVRNIIPAIQNRAFHRFIDTSYANIRQNEEIIVVQGEGSGLNRRHNSSRIVQKISSLTTDDLKLSDINIIVFSMSGGSGSVLSPVLIQEIARRGKLVIAIAISSSQSQRHAENTLNTLKSLENITNTNDIYLPISIFNNNAGIENVDKYLPYKLERLIDLLTMPASELDKNDRLHWINVPKNTDAKGCLRLLHIDSGQSIDQASLQAELWSEPNEYIFDSVINIRTVKSRHTKTPKARVSYEGIFTTIELVPMIGIIGNPPNAFEKLITEIQDILQQYKTQSLKKTSIVNITDADIDPDSGLVF